NRRLYNELGHKGYHLKLLTYPHHVLRENKILGGAHADRLQTGMAHSFGKPIGLAAQVYQGTIIFTTKVDQEGLNVAKKALSLSKPRMPGKYAIEIKKIEL
ncbi:MAG: 50S ribosomal protein L16, partial [Nanoarchaeota archaeon]